MYQLNIYSESGKGGISLTANKMDIAYGLKDKILKDGRIAQENDGTMNVVFHVDYQMGESTHLEDLALKAKTAQCEVRDLSNGHTVAGPGVIYSLTPRRPGECVLVVFFDQPLVEPA